MPPPDWMFVPFTMRVTVRHLTSHQEIREVMQDQGLGPLSHVNNVELKGARPNGWRTAHVHFSSGFCEGPLADRSEKLLTFLRGDGRAKIHVYPNGAKNRRFWVASIDFKSAGLNGAAAVDLVAPDRSVTKLPALAPAVGAPDAAQDELNAGGGSDDDEE